MAAQVANVSITCLEFVVVQSPNPIGVGLQQIILFLVHFVVVCIYGMSLMTRKTQSRSVRINSVLIGLFAIIFGVIIYSFFGESIWNCLWRLRGQ
jgi:hypothetical protein